MHIADAIAASIARFIY